MIVVMKKLVNAANGLAVHTIFLAPLKRLGARHTNVTRSKTVSQEMVSEGVGEKGATQEVDLLGGRALIGF